MAWNGLKDEVEQELGEIGLETGIAFSESVLGERTDRPVLVRGDSISVSRPVEDFSTNERGMVKWETVSDILAYEAGLSSPGTVSESDWNEIHRLYDELERGTLMGLIPESDEPQKRINACLLMRDKGGAMRSYSRKARNILQTAESINAQALGTLFSEDEALFEGGLPDNYFHLIDLVKDHERRKGMYDEIQWFVNELMVYEGVTEEGERVLEDFSDEIVRIELSDQLAENTLDNTRDNLREEYEGLVNGVDEGLMAASILYQSADLIYPGENTISDQELDKLSELDYVSENVSVQAKYLRDMVADRYFSDSEDLETCFKAAVKEYLEQA